MNRLKQLWLGLSKGKKLFILFSLILLVVVLATLAFLRFSKKGEKELTDDGIWEKLILPELPSPAYILSPSKDNRFGISFNEVFRLNTADTATEDEIKSNLEANIPVDIKKVSEKEFEISPKKELSFEEIVSFKIKKDDKDYSWAFQTVPKTKIVNSLPRDLSKSVPINAGIEITFNTDNYADILKSIEVSPDFKYRIEEHSEIVSIVPTEPLKPQTVYTIKLKSEDYSFSFQTAEEQNNSKFYISDDFQQVFPNEPLMSKVYASNWDNNTKIKATIFKFNDYSSFISSRSVIDKAKSNWMDYFAEDNRISGDNATKISEVELSIQEKDKVNYLQLPFNLDKGFYAIEFSYNDGRNVEQLWVQSTPVLGYTSVARDQTIVWLNSLEASVAESKISIVGSGENYFVNGEGWAIFPTPKKFFDKNINYLLITTSQDEKIILPVVNLNDRTNVGVKTSDDYWSYLYNERTVYRPTDTINFWGVIKNKDINEVPGVVEVNFGSLIKQNISPNSDGSFVGKIDLNNFPAGYYDLNLVIGNSKIVSSWIGIRDFEKPDIKIEINSDKKAIFANDKVTYSGVASFFDGTPASNIPLDSYSGEAGLRKKSIKADKNGNFKFEYQSVYKSDRYYPRYEEVTVTPDMSDQGKNEGFGVVNVYGSKYEIVTDSKQEENKASVDVLVNELDLDRINTQGLDDPVKGPASNRKVKIETTKTWWEKIEKGTYYDFVEKVTKPMYDYKRHDDNVESKEIETDANGRLNYQLSLEKEKSYAVSFSTVDSEGRIEKRFAYFYYYEGYDSSNGSSKAKIIASKKNPIYSLDEEVNIEIQKDGKTYQDTDQNKFFFVLANRGRQEVLVTEKPEIKFNYEKKYVPNIYIGAIIFNGKYYEEVRSGGDYYYDYYYDSHYGNAFSPIMLEYDASQSNLDLSISSEKISYQPGEKAKISVEVKKDGLPVQNSSVNIVLIDEALAALGIAKVPSTLESLYRNVGSYVYYNYYSHKPVFADEPAAEMGGGGGGDREIFKDTAFFGTGSTDSDGKVTFEFKLPDNITNWLVYAQAVNQDIEAGQAEYSVIATKEFFVTSQFPKAVLTKDKPFLAINTFGRILNNNDKIGGKISFYEGDKEISKSDIELTAFNEKSFGFPTLSPGNYKISVSGKYKEYSDTLILPLNVINSRFEFRQVEKKILDKGQKIDSFEALGIRNDKPIKLVITDEGRSQYYYKLYNYCYGDSNRIERKIAKLFANKIIKNRFNDLGCLSQKIDLSEFQSGDGGLRQVEWGNSDLESTVWSIYIDPSLFDKNLLTKYFENAISNGSLEDRILANFGLTILGKNNINELNILLSQTKIFKEKMILALAFEKAGDKEKAKSIYYDILNQYAYTNKPYIRIQSGAKNMDSYLIDTAYTLLLSSKLEKEYSFGMNLYLRDYQTLAEHIILDIAQISFVDNELSKLPNEDTIVSISSKYQDTINNLNEIDYLSIPLRSDELDSLSIKADKGKAEVSLNYYLSTDEFSKLQKDNRMSLKRSIRKIYGEGKEIKIGDILEVNLEYDFNDSAPLGCYTLRDHIPSGFTYIDSPWSYGISLEDKHLLYETRKNVVSGCAYNSPWWRKYTSNISSYYVKANAVGEYVHEPSVIQYSYDPSIFQSTSEEKVVISQ